MVTNTTDCAVQTTDVDSVPVLEAESPIPRCWQETPPGRVEGRHLHPASSHDLNPMCVCVLISSSYKDADQIASGPTLMTSSYLDQLCKDPILKYSHILKSWRLGLQHINPGGGDTIHPITVYLRMVVFTSSCQKHEGFLVSLP